MIFLTALFPILMHLFAAETICMDDDLTVVCGLLSEFKVSTFTFYELMGRTCPCEWTVFAPTDDAFAAIEDILSELTPEQIADVLTFHAIQFQVFNYDDLQCKEILTMSNGDESRTKCDKDDDTKERYKIQKGAGQLEDMMPRIIESDIEACNGVIHKLNNVMIPKL